MLSLYDRAKSRFQETPTFRITETLLETLKQELKSPKAQTPVRIANQFGVPVSLVRFISEELPTGTSKFEQHSEDGFGRAELRQYIVARKLAAGQWAREDQEAIDKARQDYDDGKSEMVQGRDGDFVIQYSIPRRRQARRDYPYFTLQEEDVGT